MGCLIVVWVFLIVAFLAMWNLGTLLITVPIAFLILVMVGLIFT